jgi:hypothetical protein
VPAMERARRAAMNSERVFAFTRDQVALGK